MKTNVEMEQIGPRWVIEMIEGTEKVIIEIFDSSANFLTSLLFFSTLQPGDFSLHSFRGKK
jgi:hypothetical protein